MEKTEKVKIEELSVGDWVCIYHRGVKTSYRIKRIFPSEYDGVYMIRTHTNWDVNINGLMPIPITPEILEKNGFIDNGLGQHYLKYGNSVTVRVGLSPLFHDGCWLVAADKEVDETIYTTCVLFDAKHVHELQRVMRLAKVEREIEL